MEENKGSNTLVYVIGAAAGLLTGLAAAFLFLRSRENTTEGHQLSSGQGVKIGMSVVSLLRQIAETSLK